MRETLLPSALPLPTLGRALVAGMAVAVLWCGLVPAPASAQQDKNTEQQRAVRRLQLQLQAAQQELQAAQSTKAQSDSEREGLNKKLQAERRAATKLRQSLKQAEDSRLAVEAERSTLGTRVAGLQQQLLEQQRTGTDALAARSQALEGANRARETSDRQWQVRLAQQVTQLDECSAKNDRLVVLGAGLLQRYRDKGLREITRQQEPLLGLGDVQMFNLVQDYRDKTDAERFRPAPGR